MATPGVVMVSAEHLSRMLLVTPERLRQLEKEGFMPKGVAGNRPLVASVQGYIRFMRDEDRRSTKSAASSRVADRRAEEIEIRIAERTRELVPFGEASACMSHLCAEVRAAVESIPARVTRDLDQRAKIQDEIDAALGKIADSMQSAADALRAGRDPAAPGSQGSA